MINYIKQKVKICTKAESALQNLIVEKEIPKNNLLHHSGYICNNLFFIKKGLIRNYYVASDKEVTSWFYAENHFVTSWHSFLNQTQSFEFIQALEDCEVSLISYNEFVSLFDEFHEIDKFFRILLEEQVSFLDQFFKGYMFLTAKEKYDLLLEYQPDITLRAKLNHISSFLGISQETLSRIRQLK